MQNLNREDIFNLANLAKVEISDSEADEFTNSINNILGYVSQVVDADIGDQENKYNFSSVAREDVSVQADFDTQIIMENVKDVSPDNFVKIVKVINK